MRLNGIHDAVGIATIDGSSTRPTLPSEVLERDIADIADGLRANAIRITGDSPERIAEAGDVAARRGLEVWLSPMLPNADPAATAQAIADSARAAECLRRGGADSALVGVVGRDVSSRRTARRRRDRRPSARSGRARLDW